MNKINEFGKLIADFRRTKGFQTSKDFHYKANLSCTYQHFSRIEKGQTPKIELALEITNFLQIPLRKALCAWSADQMPTPETRAVFGEIQARQATSKNMMDSDRIIVNRAQARLLLNDVRCYEMLDYLVIMNPSSFPLSKLAKTFDSTIEEITEVSNYLYDAGLVNIDAEGNLSSKNWLFVPFEEEFDPIRDRNFKRAVSGMFQQPRENKFRTTHHRLATLEQQKEIRERLNRLVDLLTELDDSSEGEPVTVGMFMAPRKFRFENHQQQDLS